ncbi:MAG: trigger factor [Lentisphaerae bacterium]|jgi:trigger factor|nr:trigger factor [Lentisphaerota bacterium]
MNIEIDQISQTRSKIIFNITAEEVRTETEKVTANYVKSGSIPGFRKGKAPRQAIGRKYASDIEQDTIHKIFAKYYDMAIKEKELDVYEFIGLSDFEKLEDGGLDFTMTVDLEPKFELPQYEGIPVDDADTLVTDADIDNNLEEIRQTLAEFEELKPDTEVGTGDMVSFSFTGYQDGKPMSEVFPDLTSLTERENAVTIVGGKTFQIQEISDALIGKKIGDEFTVPVEFTDDFPEEALRGISVEYKVTVIRGRHRVLPELNDDFLKTIGVESLDKLKTNVRKYLEARAKEADNRRRTEQITDFLLKSVSFEVPQAELERSAQNILQNAIQRLMQQGVAKEDIEKQREEITATSKEQAVAFSREKILLGKIAEELGIKASDELTTQYYEYAVSNWNLSENEAKAIKTEPDRWRLMEQGAIRLETLRILLEKAKPTSTAGNE